MENLMTSLSFESIGFHGEHNIKEILLGLRVFAKTRYRGEDDVKV